MSGRFVRALLWLGVVLGFTVASASADPAVSRKNAAVGVSLPLFGRDKSVPAATVKMGRLGIGAQRKGFFRVGVFPQIDAQDVWILFQRPDPTAFSDLPAALQSLGKTSSMELHDVKILAPGIAEPMLTAALVKVGDGATWELTDVLLPNGRTISKARLEVRGESAGLLLFDAEGTSTKLPLFP